MPSTTNAKSEVNEQFSIYPKILQDYYVLTCPRLDLTKSVDKIYYRTTDKTFLLVEFLLPSRIVEFIPNIIVEYLTRSNQEKVPS